MILLNNIFKYYETKYNRFEAINNISLNIDQGESLAIVGASGSGKSSLLNILGCLDSEFDGDYFFNDVSIKTLDKYKLAKIRNQNIGFVFQQYHLIPELSIYENIELPLIYAGLKDKKSKICSALDRLGISDKVDCLPNQLSGGQQQRVAIARAIVMNPSVILADEPTGALDSKTSNEILNELKSLNNDGTTIVVVTHDNNVAKQMNRIVTINDGAIISDISAGEKI